MAGPPPPPPPNMGHGPPPPQLRGVKLKNKGIKDFRTSVDPDPEAEEPRRSSKLKRSHSERNATAAAPPVRPRPPPPPPPPPFLGGKAEVRVNLDHLPTPKLFKTPRKTLRLHWAPVNPTRIDSESFWATRMNIKEEAIIHSLDKCCEHFEKPADVKVAGRGRAAQAAAERIIGKDGMEGAAESTILKSGMSPEEIRQGVLNFEWKNNHLLVILRNLRRTLNDPGKVAMLNAAKESYGNMTILDKLAGIPHVETYIQWMLRMEDFDTDCSRLYEHSDVPAIAMDRLMTNPGWLLTLKLILVVGNSMNADVTPNGAYGFDLKSINKLANTKSLSGYTFMEYLVETIEEEFPNFSQFWRDFDCLNTGMRVSDKRNTIAEETENLKKLLELLSTLLDVGKLDDTNDVSVNVEKMDLMVHTRSKSFYQNHGFVLKIIPLAVKLADTMKEVKRNLQRGDEGYTRLKQFFSIDSRAEGGGDYNIDMFMADMKQFMEGLKTAHDKIQTKRLEREKNAGRKVIKVRGRPDKEKAMASVLGELKASTKGQQRSRDHRHRHHDHRQSASLKDDPGMSRFEKMRRKFT